MTREELAAIRARDANYNDIFEEQAQMPPHIAHRLVAWPVADRRALLALLTEVVPLLEVLAGFDQEHSSNKADRHPVFGVNSHKMLHGDARAARRLLEVIR